MLSLPHSSEEVLAGVLKVKRDLDWDIVDLRWTDDALPKDVQPDGAIICYGPENAMVRNLKKLACPMVRICGVPLPSDDTVPDIVADLELAGRMAADHFAERGYKHVAYLGHKPWSNARHMYEAFADQAKKNEMVCHLHQFERHPNLSDQKKRERIRLKEIAEWLLDMPKPIGLLTYSDDRAARTCVAAAQAGILVPDDVGILGFGNNPVLCEMAPVQISSIDDNREAMGIKAASILNDIMTGRPVPKRPTYVPPKGIVERQSTNVLAVGDKDIARAIRFLWDNMDRDIGVGEVANAVGIPRRTLTRRFRQALGRSIIDELRRKRLQETKRLLDKTDMTVTDIAAQTGFRSESLLYRAFRSKFQMTPRQFRESPVAQ